jgi:hypothetical protein
MTAELKELAKTKNAMHTKPPPGAALSKRFSFQDGIVADSSGNLYVADYGNSIIRRVSPRRNELGSGHPGSPAGGRGKN